MVPRRRYRFTALPLTTTLPLVVASAMFVVAVGSTQIGVEVLRRSSEQILHNQAYVFLDALAGGIAVTIPEGAPSVERQIASALNYRSALLEESIAVRWIDTDGMVHTRFIGDRGEATLDTVLTEIFGQAGGLTRLDYSGETETVRVARTYEGEGGRFAVGAIFDGQSIAQTQRTASLFAIIIDLGVALIAALATYFLTRRMMAPLEQFIARLAPASGPSDLQVLQQGPEMRRLEHALSLREQSETERVETASRMAQQERDALLARLAASIAHEVRNPLSGLMNGVSTLKRFGDEPGVREQTIALFEQGLAQIQRVVDVTLSTYRRRSGAARLSGQDIRDLELLIAPDARRAQVALYWDVTADAQINVDADALRQILINLLINAVRATPAGGAVTLTLHTGSKGEGPRITVADTGPGMPAELVASLVTGKVDALPHERSLGIWMVANLLDQIGAHLSIASEEGVGTAITIVLAENERHASGTPA
ncbi:sensor histidine kinase [Pelagibacterium luteolum]|uniref:histidine kinase n=1 Tax=Pelagibacterium luteolum TaxID=440168 RepID=A0A1G7TTI3_9HYPH|nr:HAMP domain-containing sensor histidine kinase [Pelagibacterium luteolum]SDG38656.1 Signal transduction histidine kinase [Pelagibacterium luteolum]